jgi:hypothetical protein
MLHLLFNFHHIVQPHCTTVLEGCPKGNLMSDRPHGSVPSG